MVYCTTYPILTTFRTYSNSKVINIAIAPPPAFNIFKLMISAFCRSVAYKVVIIVKNIFSPVIKSFAE